MRPMSTTGGSLLGLIWAALNAATTRPTPDSSTPTRKSTSWVARGCFQDASAIPPISAVGTRSPSSVAQTCRKALTTALGTIAPPAPIHSFERSPHGLVVFLHALPVPLPISRRHVTIRSHFTLQPAAQEGVAGLHEIHPQLNALGGGPLGTQRGRQLRRRYQRTCKTRGFIAHEFHSYPRRSPCRPSSLFTRRVKFSYRAVHLLRSVSLKNDRYPAIGQ